MTTIQNKLNEIAKCSLDKEGVTRYSFTKEHRKAVSIITKWMTDAGLKVSMDDAGTLIGNLQSSNKQAKTLLLGSHQDTVKNGGKYDGIMGILLPILALKNIKKKKIHLPFHVQVLAFADEEGMRFPTSLLGSRALAGTFKKSYLRFKDKNNNTISDALKSFKLSPKKILKLKRDKKKIIGFIETHIEQGPVLEKNNLPLGIVTGIAGISRFNLVLLGHSSHAGTTPVKYRKDSLLGLNEINLMCEKIAKQNDDIIITIGEIHNKPNVPNAIPSTSTAVIEFRSINNKKRINTENKIKKLITQIAKKRNLKHQFYKTYDQEAVMCNEKLKKYLVKAFKKLKMKPFQLPSGATHDASAMSDLCDISMLFVRSKNGLSHNPKEYSSETDMKAALKILETVILNVN